MADDYDKSPISLISVDQDSVGTARWALVTAELSRFAMGRASNGHSDGTPVASAHVGRKVLANIELQPGPDAATHSGQRKSLFVRWVASF